MPQFAEVRFPRDSKDARHLFAPTVEKPKPGPLYTEIGVTMPFVMFYVELLPGEVLPGDEACVISRALERLREEKPQFRVSLHDEQ